MESRAGFRRYLRNTSWLFLARFVELGVSLLVSVRVVRYLGPTDYGVLSYALSLVGLLSAFASLGIDAVLVRELLAGRETRGRLLGSAFGLKALGGTLLLAVLVVGVALTGGDRRVAVVVVAVGFGPLLRAFDVIDAHFQASVQAGAGARARLASVAASAAVKLTLVQLDAPLQLFAMSIALDALVYALGLLVSYRRANLSVREWSFDAAVGRGLLASSWPFVVSGVFTAIYMQIDQVMLKEMLGSAAVGNYAVAARVSETFYFIPMLTAASLFPAIANAKRVDEKLYNARLQRLYDLMTLLSVAIAIVVSLTAGEIIRFLFGDAYTAAAGVLRVHVWAGILVFFGVVRGRWILLENMQRTQIWIDVIGGIANIALNLVLIPRYGPVGAAYATLLSYFVASYPTSYAFSGLRPSFHMYNRSWANLLTLRVLRVRET